MLNSAVTPRLNDVIVQRNLEFIHKGAIWQVIGAALFEALYLMDLVRECDDLHIHEWYNGKLFVHAMRSVHEDQLSSLKLNAEISTRMTSLIQQITAGLEMRLAVLNRPKPNTHKPRTNIANKAKSVSLTSNIFAPLSPDSMETDDDE